MYKAKTVFGDTTWYETMAEAISEAKQTYDFANRSHNTQYEYEIEIYRKHWSVECSDGEWTFSNYDDAYEEYSKLVEAGVPANLMTVIEQVDD